MSYRNVGELPGIHKETFPRKLLIFDTESFRGNVVNGTEVQSFRLCVSHYIELNDSLDINREEWYQTKTTEAFADYVELMTRKDQSLYIYAHNIKFDLQLSGLLTRLLEHNWEIKTFTMDDPPTFIKLHNGRKTIILVDTFNYWQTSISEMGKQLGLPKLSMPENEADDKVMFIYCKRDVEVLSNYLLSYFHFLQDNDLCGCGLTLASQAMRSYRHRFMQNSIILHNDPLATQLERSGYSGGRVEAYYLGQLPEQTYYKLDVNSMYPYVMSENLYPVELKGVSNDVSIERVRAIMRTNYVIVDCTVETNVPAYAVKSENKLVFPVGIFRTVLHHIDVMRAIRLGEIKQVHQIAIYRQAKIFTSYVDFFYRQKLQASIDHNEVIRHQAKIMLNSLYGKFGQTNIESHLIDNFSNIPFGRIVGYSETLGKRVETVYLGSKLQISTKGGESAYSFPAIAGAVTAYARNYLWTLIEIAGRENTFYTDTDSLVTNAAGFQRLQAYIDNNRLGMLKVEGQTTYFYIYGLKDYVYGAEKKHKGIPHNAVEIASGEWQYQQARGGISWMNLGMPQGMEWYTRFKHRSGLYTKGIPQLDGSVLPLTLRSG